MPYQPDLTRNPTDQDAIDYLLQLPVVNRNGDSIGSLLAPIMQGTVQSALQQFFAATGLPTVLPSGTDSLYQFSPPGKKSISAPLSFLFGGDNTWYLPFPFVSITDVVMGISTNYSAGTPYPKDAYRLMQEVQNGNPGNLVNPITGIDWFSTQWGTIQSVGILGQPGLGATWPADAWRGVIMGALASVTAEGGFSIMGGLLRIQESDTSEFADIDPLKTLHDSWDKQFRSAIRRYAPGMIA